jgi:hypothetical protein
MTTLPLLHQIDDIFNINQCNMLIDLAEKKGFEYIDRSNAQYHRTILDNEQLAYSLFQKLRNYIPSYWEGKKIIGLNNIFRFSKYFPKQEFGIHKDGINQDSKGNRSVMTLNIFLNDSFDGGETNFFFSNNENDLRLCVQPKAGRGALFDSQQFHKGNIIKSGIKYLIRTDVMVSDF